MIIDQINLNHLRIFEVVYRTRSMTEAAQELHLTQSGVSQHVKSLEDVLGMKLFDRLNQKIVPTQTATYLFDQCSKSLGEMEQALWHIKGGDKELKGTTIIGMPTEFGINIVLPLLARFSQDNPFVKYKIRFGLAGEMNERLMSGDVDFAFVDDFRLDRRVTAEPVYDETLELCIRSDLVKDAGAIKNNRKYYETLNYVDYQEGEPILRMWFHHHLGTEHLDVTTKAVALEVQAVAKLVVSGLGAAVLPKYVATKIIDGGTPLHVFKGSGKPLKNTISIAQLTQRSHSPTTLALVKALRGWLKRK